jgi:hypothetical protein
MAQSETQFDDKGISKLVKTKPQLLGLNADENIEHKLAWLQQRLSLDNNSLSVVAQRMPQLLCCNIEKNLEPIMKFYEDCVELDAARASIANNPNLLGYTASRNGSSQDLRNVRKLVFPLIRADCNE